MTIIKRFFLWLFRQLPRSDYVAQTNKNPLESLPITFREVVTVERPPNNAEIDAASFYLVIREDQAKWVLFKCPCGCGYVTTLSMQDCHTPHWSLTQNSHLPTLFPSIWQNTPCFSHFWLKQGRIVWCSDSGTPPQ